MRDGSLMRRNSQRRIRSSSSVQLEAASSFALRSSIASPTSLKSRSRIASCSHSPSASSTTRPRQHGPRNGSRRHRQVGEQVAMFDGQHVEDLLVEEAHPVAVHHVAVQFQQLERQRVSTRQPVHLCGVGWFGNIEGRHP